ncbi:MAG: LPS assembly lipoprotein LptE [Gammaproteobacteria bacterium]|nr:hypothetical protein [Gammaproteobacteria bacterium]MDP6095396.1 LPS assembly lipoprotein LptE [Gammaproteobacteria bacterium]MDP7455737.1 LPS assembly lipoprotein LptE [Gammaproteobacteria bacterium]HJO10480.1 LPS assembly lipoprotein LptE [Gammaproteobacteria bacterium]
MKTQIHRTGLLTRLMMPLLVAGLLSACGYSLRGSEVLTSQFQQLRLNLAQQNSEFGRLLRRSLTGAGVEVELVDGLDTDAANFILVVSDEQIDRRPITINPRARAAQYEILLSINFTLGRGEDILLGPEPLFVEDVYFEDIENISGTQDEIEIITNEMRRELVNQLMRRLERVNTQVR